MGLLGKFSTVHHSGDFGFDSYALGDSQSSVFLPCSSGS